MFTNVVSYLLIVIVLLITTSQCGYVDDICILDSTGQEGKCLLLRDCPKAIEDLTQRQIYPQQCGYQGTQPIVCCPQGTAPPRVTTQTTTTTTTTTTPRTFTQTTSDVINKADVVGIKSREKCQEYSRYVFEEQPPPVLLPNAKPIKVDKCASRAGELIVGGEKTIPREFPHMALIGFDADGERAWQCGGTLISELFVLTAGHCLYSKELGDPRYVLLGDLDINRTDDDAQPQLFNVKEKIYHPNYRPPASYNDIALLKLDKPAILNTYVRPACLYTDSEIRATKALATGWGKIGFTKETSSHLLKVALEVFTYDRCGQTYKNLQLKLPRGVQERTQVCWGSQTEEKDTCRGDSGGPLQIGSKNIYCMYEIIGVTSVGKACGFVNIPAIYTRVSYYVGWIESVVWGT